MCVVSIRAADRVNLALLLLIVVGLWLPRLHGPIDLRWDAGSYYLTGVALASGKGYRILSEPGDIAAIQYPPLLPAIVAGVSLAAGDSDPPVLGHYLRLLYFVLSIANSLAAYIVARRFLPPGWALFAALIPTLHTHTIFMSDILFAELPYSLITLLFFLCVLPADNRRAAIAEVRPRLWLSGSLAAAAFLIRTAGIALLVAWIVDNALCRQWRSALIALSLAVLCVGGWQAYAWRIKTDPAYTSPAYPYQRAAYQFYNVSYFDNLQYIDPFRPELGKIGWFDWAARAGRNLRPMIARIGESITAPRKWGQSAKSGANTIRRIIREQLSPLQHGVYVFALLPIAGLLILAWRREWLLPTYVAASLALICITPWPSQFLRYLSPLAPVLSILTAIALMALTKLFSWILPRASSVLAPAPAIVIASLIFVIQILALHRMFGADADRATYRERNGREEVYSLFYYDRFWKAQNAAMDWLATTAGHKDVVVTSTPHLVAIWAGIKAVMPPFEPDPAIAQALIDSIPAKYLVIDSFQPPLDMASRYLAPIVKRFPERWKRVYSVADGGVQVYERRDNDTASESKPP
jgi:hypothetical protein